LSPKAPFQKKKKNSRVPSAIGKKGKEKTIFFKNSGQKGRCTEADARFQNKPGNDTFSPDQKRSRKKTKDHPFYRMATPHLCILYTKAKNVSMNIIVQSPF
jgi:hypothetical protein